MSDDRVNHPSHYTGHPSGIECIQVVEHMTFNVGNAVKYLWRAGVKSETTHLEDLRKAAWYINREIERLSASPPKPHPPLVDDSGDVWIWVSEPRNGCSPGYALEGSPFGGTHSRESVERVYGVERIADQNEVEHALKWRQQ